MPTKQLTVKDPAEIVPITFDFSAVLTTISSVISVSIAVKTGVDAGVASMIEGAAQISGTQVIQLIKNGVSGVTYTARCEVQSGSERYALAAILPIETA